MAKKLKGILVILMTLALLSTTVTFAFAKDFESFKPYEDSQYFTYGDYSIHYRVIPAKGETKGRIMMLHGFLCSTYSWRNMAPLLADDGYEVVLADLPSFGYSTRESADIEQINREVLITELMKSIAPIDEWILAGHSMGGGVAINIAEEQPVKALLLFCPAPQNGFPSAFESIVTSKPMEAFMNLFFNYGTKITPLVKMIIYAATLDWKFSMTYDVSGLTDAVQYDNFGAGMCEMMYRVRETALEHTDKITCPVLICQASGDIVLSSSMKEQISTAFPDATTYEVKKGGHQCIENRADELSKVSLDFLKAI